MLRLLYRCYSLKHGLICQCKRFIPIVLISFLSGKNWGYFDRKSGKMVRWEYLLQDREGNPGIGDTTIWNWEEWRKHGDVMLSTERISPDGKSKVTFKNLQVFKKLPDFVFSQTAAVDLNRLSSSPGQ